MRKMMGKKKPTKNGHHDTINSKADKVIIFNKR